MYNSIYAWIFSVVRYFSLSFSDKKNPYVFPFPCVLHGLPLIIFFDLIVLRVLASCINYVSIFPVFVWHCIHKHWKRMCFSGFGLILVIHCLFISAIGFRELFALQIGKKSPYERQMTNEYLLCGLPYKAGAISCVWHIASVPQCSLCITQGGLV
jgi:hypothetical protein